VCHMRCLRRWFLSYEEEEDTCVSYEEEEDTCVSYEVSSQVVPFLPIRQLAASVKRDLLTYKKSPTNIPFLPILLDLSTHCSPVILHVCSHRSHNLVRGIVRVT